MLDARIVAANMYQRNALTLKELQSIQNLKDRSVEAAETLVNIIMEQPDDVYLCFLDVLKHTEQLHIYQRLVEDGYKGKALLSLSQYRRRGLKCCSYLWLRLYIAYLVFLISYIFTMALSVHRKQNI